MNEGCLDGMDEVVDNDVNAIEAIDGTHFQVKENGYSLKTGSSNMLEFIPGEGADPEGSLDLSVDLLDGKNLGRIGASEHACAIPRCMDDAGVMVEELTLKNYNSENLAIVRDRVQTRQNQWQHLYQIAGGSGSGGSHGDAAYRVRKGEMPSVWEDMGFTVLPDFLDNKLSNDHHNEVMEHLRTKESKPVLSNTVSSPGGMRTKILSKSGFSEYFVKNTLKGKGLICRGPAREEFVGQVRGQNYPNAADVTIVDSQESPNSSAETVGPPANCITDPGSGICSDAFLDGSSLRDWLKAGDNKVNRVKRLYMFRQIVNLVDVSHSQGVALQDLRPSCFKLLSSNQIIYVGSSVQKEITQNYRDRDIHYSDNVRNEKRPVEQGSFPIVSQWAKKRKFGENMNFIRRRPQFPNRSGTKSATANCTNVKFGGPQDSWNGINAEHSFETENKIQIKSSFPQRSNISQLLSTSVSDPLEEKWYTSPEELSESHCTFSSNIYCLGVLLFELIGSFNSGRAHAAAMLDLRHRILPPNFLSENPKEAGFCLWLLHPEPSSRPTTREVLQSEFVSGIQELSGDDLSSSINQEDSESEMLMHFLTSLKEQKQKNATKLVEEVRFLEADIEEVEKRQTEKSLFLTCLPKESLNEREIRSLHREHPSLMNYNRFPASSNESRLMRNMSQLESAYFSVRSNVQLSDNDLTTRDNKELLESRESWCHEQKDEEKHKPTDRLGIFFSGLCRYARYSKIKVCGTLRNGDFNNSANVICSLSFDRDEDYFAAAGVSKKIKIYDFHALCSDVDINYPVIEIPNKSKLSCICWNSYIGNYLASTDYDGVVKLWDAGSGQRISQYVEHNKRAWSVDFSQVDPTKLASGSDDCSVKLWSINEKNSLCTIRNIANVCCVQFSADSSHMLSFGSADYKTYCYDLRNVSSPWCILAGHDKAVSHVKFLDSETLVSASTDNTLKIWDLNKSTSSGLSTNACISTLRGHTNEKNFVGLSVADGYIACGSETNEVFAYYRSLPMPITSHKFGSFDPISGKETDDDNGQFVSSVCWRRKSEMVVSANSSGCIKLLQMV